MITIAITATTKIVSKKFERTDVGKYMETSKRNQKAMKKTEEDRISVS